MSSSSPPPPPPHVVEDMPHVLQLLSDGTVVRFADYDTLPPPSVPPAPLPVRWKDVVYDATHGLKLRVYSPSPPASCGKLPVLVYFHGGGYVLGTFALPSFHACCLRLAGEIPAVVLSADYRLAPEHRLPAALDDAAAVMRWVRAQAVAAGGGDPWLADSADPGRVFVAGDSAGGNIVHHVAVRRLGSAASGELDPVRVAGHVMLCPFFGGAERTASEAEFPPGPFLTLPWYDQAWRLALPPGATRDHPFANPFGPESPALLGLRDVALPPTLVVAAGQDLLRDRQADYVARRIRALIDGGASVWENGAERPAHYGDVVILLRSANSVGPVYRAALEAQGIPVSAETSGGFYTSEEVSVLCSLLAVVDNPHQDVPLIAALRSPLFGLTADDLAAVRTCDREHDFYTAVTLAAETRDDCRDFLDVLARYRALSIELPLGEFLWHVVDDRAVMALTSAMPDGELRRRNVLLLLDLAQQFERTGARGLHRFLLWMQRQAAEGEEPTVPGSESRSVRILSIHKSKGLEFPFVFLCDTARLFNKSDTRASVLVHPALGLGPKCTDLEHGVEYPTIARQAIAAQLLTETLSEEMRLLYVAMTRAKERLIITGTTHSIAKTTGWLEATASAPLPPELLRGMASPLFWLLQSALLDRDERFLRRNYVYLKPDAAAERAETETGPALPEPDPALLAQLERALTFRYAHAQAVDLPSKVTATELKRLEAEDAPPEDAGAPLLAGAPRTQTFRRPDFSARARKLTAAERGTATHRILQYLRFADARTPEGIRAQVETLTARGELTGREAQAVDTASLLRLGRTELGAQLAAAEAAGTLRREFCFSLLCPAETFFPGAGEEQVLLQGVVDAWFETKDGLVIVDYKTDRIRPEGVPARTAYYAAQLRAYAGAMARITGQPVCRRVLYFLHCGQVSDVPGPDA